MFRVNDTVCLVNHPEIFGICEGRVVSSNETNGQILVRLDKKKLSSEAKKILKNFRIVNPRSEYSFLCYFDSSELKPVEQHDRTKRKTHR